MFYEDIPEIKNIWDQNGKTRIKLEFYMPQNIKKFEKNYWGQAKKIVNQFGGILSELKEIHSI